MFIFYFVFSLVGFQLISHSGMPREQLFTLSLFPLQYDFGEPYWYVSKPSIYSLRVLRQVSVDHSGIPQEQLCSLALCFSMVSVDHSGIPQEQLFSLALCFSMVSVDHSGMQQEQVSRSFCFPCYLYN